MTSAALTSDRVLPQGLTPGSYPKVTLHGQLRGTLRDGAGSARGPWPWPSWSGSGLGKTSALAGGRVLGMCVKENRRLSEEKLNYPGIPPPSLSYDKVGLNLGAKAGPRVPLLLAYYLSFSFQTNLIPLRSRRQLGLILHA
jgi:hypothetical protein